MSGVRIFCRCLSLFMILIPTCLDGHLHYTHTHTPATGEGKAGERKALWSLIRWCTCRIYCIYHSICPVGVSRVKSHAFHGGMETNVHSKVEAKSFFLALVYVLMFRGRYQVHEVPYHESLDVKTRNRTRLLVALSNRADPEAPFSTLLQQISHDIDLYLQFPLHLVMHACNAPSLLPSEDILPLDKRLPALEHILMDAGDAATQRQRLPLALARNLKLHAAADRLRDAERPAEGGHAQALLGGLPGLEARLEWMGRDGCRRCRRFTTGRWGGLGERGRADAVPERVVQAWCGGGAFLLCADVREGGVVGLGWDDAERLCRHSKVSGLVAGDAVTIGVW